MPPKRKAAAPPDAPPGGGKKKNSGSGRGQGKKPKYGPGVDALGTARRLAGPPSPPSALMPLPPMPTPQFSSPVQPPVSGRLLVPTPKPAPKSGEDGAADAEKADKIARMKRLLGAADRRLEKAQAELQERDQRIQLLEARLKQA